VNKFHLHVSYFFYKKTQIHNLFMSMLQKTPLLELIKHTALYQKNKRLLRDKHGKQVAGKWVNSKGDDGTGGGMVEAVVVVIVVVVVVVK